MAIIPFSLVTMNLSFFNFIIILFFMAMQLQIEGYLKFQSPPTPETFHEVQYRLCPG